MNSTGIEFLRDKKLLEEYQSSVTSYEYTMDHQLWMCMHNSCYLDCIKQDKIDL